MSNEIYNIFLGFVVAWPLLLTIPALHTRLPWPCFWAIFPAAVLMILPGEAFVAPSWFLFGTGLGVNSEARWILAMTVIVWSMTVAVVKFSSEQTYNFRTPFFFLTLAGNLGAVLATDLVVFVCASTLMGYSFYGLLLQRRNESSYQAGKIYLIFLIIADLTLFDALLLAAFETDDLRFESVRQAMTSTADTSITYLWLVLIGFGLKAGVWPFHLWLIETFKYSSWPARLLLGSVPVAVGLLGIVRWAPLGGATYYIPGLIYQGLGIVALLYIIIRAFSRIQITEIPAWTIVAVTGLCNVALGVGLAYPSLWHKYQYLVYPLIALTGVFTMFLSYGLSRTKDESISSTHRSSLNMFKAWSENWAGLMQQRKQNIKTRFVLLWGTVVLKFKFLHCFQKWGIAPGVLEQQLQYWPNAITLFLILVIVVALSVFL
ncbi:MAG: proton-conducting transporter membrane subunit [Gammaproteobacteria bacterium]|nr:proton-conducting transporter membrane subunit [Gammaproteobacteria bacterium]